MMKVAIFLVAALLLQTQVTEATFYLDYFEKWHPYFQQQKAQQQASTPPRIPPTTAATPPPRVPTPPPPRAPATPSGGAQFPNIAAAAIATPTLSTLVEIASAVGLAETLADENLIATAFAPTNAAFAKFLKAYNLTSDQVVANPDLARLVLSYHLVPGVAATASSLTNGQVLKTQDQGQTITVIKSGRTVLLDPTGQDDPNARVVQADIKAGKAIIHIVDEVLIPANFPLSRGGAANAAAAASTNVTMEGTVTDERVVFTTATNGAIQRARDAVEEGTEFERPDINVPPSNGVIVVPDTNESDRNK